MPGPTTIDIEPGYRPQLIDRGSGAVVVFLHGTPFDVRAWGPVADLMTDDVRSIRFDARGHGSAAEVPVSDFARLAEDVVAVLDLLGVADAHVVGHSWGGQTAQRLALDHPRRVSRLSLVCTRASPFPPMAAAAEAVRRGDADLEATLSRWFTPAELAVTTGLAATVRGWLREADPARWADALEMIAGFDVLARLPEISVPVDLVAAEHDVVSMPEHMLEMAEALPNARFHRLQGAGHLVPLQRPADVVRVLHPTSRIRSSTAT